MRKKTRSPIIIVTTYILIFILGIVVGNQILIPSKPIPELTPLPVQNYSASVNILAVKSNDNSGVLGKVTVEIYPGKGRVLMDTNPFLEPDTQFSAETAVNVAQNYTKKDLSNKDVIISFDIGGQLLGGPSAGAAMTTATIAAIENKQVKKDVAVTGTIEPSGKIGVIGGVIEKAQAAANNGVKLFLVPEAELYLTYYEQQVKKERIGPGFTIQRINYVPKNLDLNNYTMSEFGMETKGVFGIGDVVKYMLE
jgi:predicted S18 family serine protease